VPRKPRFFVPGIAAHIVQRGNIRQATFFEEADYGVYLSLLNEGRDRYDCEIHAYFLMTNHVHLLITPNRIRHLATQSFAKKSKPYYPQKPGNRSVADQSERSPN
jgi:putative transposase